MGVKDCELCGRTPMIKVIVASVHVHVPRIAVDDRDMARTEYLEHLGIATEDRIVEQQQVQIDIQCTRQTFHHRCAAGPGAAAGRGGPPGAGGPGGGFGGFGGFGGGAPADPVILSRNGRVFEANGQTTIRSGAEVKVETARESVSLSLSDMDNGSWVIFELPGFKTAAAGAERSSLAALRDASDTSYYKDGDTLWVKLVVETTGEAAPGPFGARTSIDVSK